MSVEDTSQTQAFVSCPACGGVFAMTRHSWIKSCGKCGLLSSTLEPHIPSVPTTSIVDETERLRGLAEPRRRSNAVILDVLAQHATEIRNVLDVGSGHGLFLDDAKDRGFAVSGIEPDANVFASLSKRHNVRHGYFPHLLGVNERYDAIIFNDVLEHIPDVEGTVAACFRHIRPGGVLVMNCPSRHGVFFRLSNTLDQIGLSGPFDRLWQRNLPSPHLWYFTPSDLHRIASRAGFIPQDTIHLTPIQLNGLRQRIFHVKGQSSIVSYGALITSLLMLPLLRLLPKDIGISVVIKPK